LEFWPFFHEGMHNIQKFRNALDLINEYLLIFTASKIIELLPKKIWVFIVGQLKFGIKKIYGQTRLFGIQQSAFAHLPGTEQKKTGFRQAVLQVSYKHSR